MSRPLPFLVCASVAHVLAVSHVCLFVSRLHCSQFSAHPPSSRVWVVGRQTFASRFSDGDLSQGDWVSGDCALCLTLSRFSDGDRCLQRSMSIHRMSEPKVSAIHNCIASCLCFTLCGELPLSHLIFVLFDSSGLLMRILQSFV